MYKHMLVAVDGQELSNKALTQAIELAKAIGAKITVLTVTPRWSTVAAGGDVAVMFPPEAHEANIAEAARLLLSKAAAIAEIGRSSLQLSACERCASLQGHSRHGFCEGLRSHRHGLARPARHGRPAARQRDTEDPDPREDSGSSLQGIDL